MIGVPTSLPARSSASAVSSAISRSNVSSFTAAAHSVGINETFQAVPRLVESHVLDETELNLYDMVVSLEFVDFVRPAAKFDGVEALVAQINLDLEVVRNQLGL